MNIKKIVLSVVFLIMFSNSALAYLGPGMGGGVVVATLGILGAILLAFLGILYYPIKRAINKRKQLKSEAEQKDKSSL